MAQYQKTRNRIGRRGVDHNRQRSDRTQDKDGMLGLEARRKVAGLWFAIRINPVEDNSGVQKIIDDERNFVAVVTMQVTKDKHGGGIVSGLPVRVYMNGDPWPSSGEKIQTEEGRISEVIPVKTGLNFLEFSVGSYGIYTGGSGAVFFVVDPETEKLRKTRLLASQAKLDSDIKNAEDGENLRPLKKRLAKKDLEISLKAKEKELNPFPAVKEIQVEKYGNPGSYRLEVLVIGEKGVLPNRAILVTELRGRESHHKVSGPDGAAFFYLKFEELERRYRISDTASGKYSDIVLSNL